jgi:hypothetical protein
MAGVGEDEQLYCNQCGTRILEVAPGRWRHDPETAEEGYDLDEDHKAWPDEDGRHEEEAG